METEFIITLAIVVAAGAFVAVRWFRSAKRALKPGAPGTCGGCDGCAVPPELRPKPGQDLNFMPGSDALAACNEARQSDSTSTGSQSE